MSYIVHRVAKSAARYTDAGGREKCGYCRFFVAPRACGKVIGPVSPQGWCKYFSRQAVSLSGGGLAASAGGASFDQNFLTGSLGAGAVFTRASTGTYYNASGVLVGAAINTPRFDYDPQTLQLKGLLLEDASTNIWLNSADVSLWDNNLNPVVITINQIVSPDGTMTGDRAAFPSAANTVLAQGLNVTAVPYTFSIWMKGNVGGEQLYIMTTPDGVLYYRLLVTLTTTWQRFTLTTPALTAGVWYFQIGIDIRDTSQSIKPAQTLFMWGAQVEALPYMSSHIPTTSVSVTRAADVLRYPIASVTGFSQTQGSLVHEYILEGTQASYGSPISFTGTDINADYIYPDQFAGVAVPQISSVVSAAAGVLVAETFYPANILIPINTIHRGGSSWALNANMGGAHNGAPTTVVGTGPAASLPVITDLRIAYYVHYQPLVNQWARRTRYWPRQLSQAELISATTLAGPTLSLDFMQPGTLDPRITFTRASSATYTDASGVIQTAATNAPRWDYANGVLRGLLIEEARTNLILWSRDITQSAWTKIGSPVVTATVAAPDGTTTAQTINLGLSSGPSFYQIVTLATGTRGEPSFWINVVSATGSPTLVVANPVNTANGQWTVNPALIGTGWQRITRGHPAVSIVSEFTGLTNQAGIFVFVNQGSLNASWWGWSFEAGAFPTSYIPTTSVSVTRAADVATMPTNVSWYSGTDGTIVAETLLPPNGNSGFRGLFTLGTNVAIPWLRMFSVNGSAGVDATVDVTGFNVGTMIPGNVFRAGMTYAASGSRSALGGVTGQASAVVSTPSTFTTLRFGQASVDGTNIANGYIRRVNYWNRALSDTEMQQVTT
jgi:hypothetical protein